MTDLTNEDAQQKVRNYLDKTVPGFASRAQNVADLLDEFGAAKVSALKQDDLYPFLKKLELV